MGLFIQAAKGFAAAALVVLTVNQVIIFALDFIGFIERRAWSITPSPPWGVPTLLNAMFWGGLWGALFAVFYTEIPGQEAWLKGLIFGWIIFIFSNCLVLPLVKGGPLFYGFEVSQLVSVFLILSAFGSATALLYAYLAANV